MVDFESAASWAGDDAGRFVGEITDDWAQGRTAFGGLLVTATLRAMAGQLPPDRQLRSALVTFVAPVSIGAVHAEVSLLRAGRSLSLLEGRVSQESSGLCALIVAAFAAGRETKLSLPSPPRPEAPGPEAALPFPFVPGVTPTFSQHFEYRWTASALPFTGGEEALVQGWVRSRDGGAVDGPAALSLIDAWPPPILPVADRPHPISSVTWQVDLLGELPEGGVDPAAWWFFESTVVAAQGGYADTSGRLWTPEGRLLATSRQLVAEFSAQGRDAPLKV